MVYGGLRRATVGIEQELSNKSDSHPEAADFGLFSKKTRALSEED